MQKVQPQEQEILELRNENEQLKNKYKKALQELMQVLKINKTLKEHPSLNLDRSGQAEHPSTRSQEKEQVQKLNTMLEQLKLKELEKEQLLHSLEQKNNSLQAELHQTSSLNQQLQQQLSENREKSASLKSAEEVQQIIDSKDRQIHEIKRQTQELRRNSFEHSNTQREIQTLKKQVNSLKDALAEKQQQLQQQRLKSRNQANQLEEHYLSLRKEELQKTKNIQYKCMLLENQLHNQKNMEQYLQSEHAQIENEEIIFNQIRTQMGKIHQDWQKIETDNQEQLIHAKTQQEEANRTIATLTQTNSQLTEEINSLRKQNKQIESALKEKERLSTQITQNQQEKKELLEKNYVLEALTLTQAHRSGAEVSDRIEEFERKVQLLLEEKGQKIGGMAGLQQIITLKSYVKELSQMVNTYKKRQQKLIRSKSALKIRQHSLEKDYKTKLQQCKKKISNYDALVMKFYGLLEGKTNQKPIETEKQFELTVAQYQQKMLKMSEEIIILHKKIKQLQDKGLQRRSTIHKANNALEEEQKEIEQLKQHIEKQQFHISGLEVQNNNLIAENNQLHQNIHDTQLEAKQLIAEKDKFMAGLTKQNETFERVLLEQKDKEKRLLIMIEDYHKEVDKLRSQLEEKHRQLNDDEQTADLISKISRLEQELNKVNKDKEELSRMSSDILKDNIKQYEFKFESQSEEIQLHRTQIQHLKQQLEAQQTQNDNLRSNLKYINEQHKNQLQNAIAKKKKLELTCADLESQLEETEDKYKEEIANLEDKLFETTTELTHKQAELERIKGELERSRNDTEAEVRRSTKEIVIENEDFNTQAMKRYKKEIDQLHSTILMLRTSNIALENEVKDKEITINDLKDQIYNKSLQRQKEKSSGNILIRQSQNGQTDKLIQTLNQTQQQNNALKAQIKQLQELNRELLKKINQHSRKQFEDKFSKALENNTSIENKIDLRPESPNFTPKQYRVAESYDFIPTKESSSALRPDQKDTAPFKSAFYQPTTNFESSPFDSPKFQKKRAEGSNGDNSSKGARRSIKMIKLSAKPSFELDSPLLPPEKRYFPQQ